MIRCWSWRLENPAHFLPAYRRSIRSTKSSKRWIPPSVWSVTVWHSFTAAFYRLSGTFTAPRASPAKENWPFFWTPCRSLPNFMTSRPALFLRCLLPSTTIRWQKTARTISASRSGRSPLPTPTTRFTATPTGRPPWMPSPTNSSNAWAAFFVCAMWERFAIWTILQNPITPTHR